MTRRRRASLFFCNRLRVAGIYRGYPGIAAIKKAASLKRFPDARHSVPSDRPVRAALLCSPRRCTMAYVFRLPADVTALVNELEGTLCQALKAAAERQARAP